MIFSEFSAIFGFFLQLNPFKINKNNNKNKNIFIGAGPAWMRRGSATQSRAAPTRRMIKLYIVYII